MAVPIEFAYITVCPCNRQKSSSNMSLLWSYETKEFNFSIEDTTEIKTFWHKEKSSWIIGSRLNLLKSQMKGTAMSGLFYQGIIWKPFNKTWTIKLKFELDLMANSEYKLGACDSLVLLFYISYCTIFIIASSNICHQQPSPIWAYK